MPMELVDLKPEAVMVVAPHMDDEVIGAGGSLALHNALGSEVRVAFCCAGATEEVDMSRRAEALQASALLGFDEVCFLGLPDGQLCLHEVELGRRLAELIERWRPTVIFCPYPADSHSDHTASAMGLSHGLKSSGFSGEVWTYEVWSPQLPNAAVNITSVVDQKRAAIAAYKSQVAGVPYANGSIGLNQYRGMQVYVPAAESFTVLSPADFHELAAQMNIL